MNLGVVRRVAVFAARFAFILCIGLFGSDWLETQFGEDTVRTVAGWVLLAVFVVFVVMLIPLMIAGLREILAEPATGPVRLPSIRRRSR